MDFCCASSLRLIANDHQDLPALTVSLWKHGARVTVPPASNARVTSCCGMRVPSDTTVELTTSALSGVARTGASFCFAQAENIKLPMMTSVPIRIIFFFHFGFLSTLIGLQFYS
jgi:hypothetical protein